MLECNNFSEQTQRYLQWKDLDGPQGGYTNYQEYCDTVSALNACRHNNYEKFKSLIKSLGYTSDKILTVTYHFTPHNPYSNLQTMDGSCQKSLSEIVKEYGNESCLVLLESNKKPEETTKLKMKLKLKV